MDELTELSDTFFQSLVSALSFSLASLNAKPTPMQLETWSSLIHQSMSGAARSFHAVQHVFDISKGSKDPILILSALFHDLVYYNVDKGLNSLQHVILKNVIKEEIGETDNGEETAVLLNPIEPSNDIVLAIVIQIFGFSLNGQILTQFQGQNEFMSAVIAARSLSEVLDLKYLAMIAACIEMTIAFRSGPVGDELYKRLKETSEQFSLDFTHEELESSVQRAVELGNRDVANFASPDKSVFLSYTWCLIPETNSTLRNGVYTIYQYHSALRKMYGFFDNLDHTLIFGSYKNKPDKEALNKLTMQGLRNLMVGRKYIRAKLVAVSTLSAFAKLTGGDCILSIFVGDLPSKVHKTRKFEEFLPSSSSILQNSDRSHIIIDEEVMSLLSVGRKSESGWDVKNSPLASFIYASVGDEEIERLLKYTACPMDEERSEKLLKALPTNVVNMVAEGCGHFAVTRKDLLMDVANSFS